MFHQHSYNIYYGFVIGSVVTLLLNIKKKKILDRHSKVINNNSKILNTWKLVHL